MENIEFKKSISEFASNSAENVKVIQWLLNSPKKF